MTAEQSDPQLTEAALRGSKLITIKEIRAKFGLGRTAGYDLVRRPDFPARIVVSLRCHRWLESEVDAFQETLRDRPLGRRVNASRRAQVPGPAAMPRRLAGQEHPVRPRQEGR